MGELGRMVTSATKKEPITGTVYNGTALTKTLTVNELSGMENFILYAERDGVHTDCPNILGIQKMGTSVSAIRLYYSDGKYMVGTESCTISGGTITTNSNFRKQCTYRYVAW